MTQARRFLSLFTVALVIAWIAWAVVVYGQLPDTIATHFGPNGVADGFSRRSIFSWFGLTIVGLGTTSLCLVLAYYTHSNPSMYNIPGKDKLLALPKHAQAPLLEQLAMWMTLMALAMVVLFSAMQYDMWRVAVTDQKGLGLASWIALAVTMSGFLIAMPIFIFTFERKIDAARLSRD